MLKIRFAFLYFEFSFPQRRKTRKVNMLNPQFTINNLQFTINLLS